MPRSIKKDIFTLEKEERDTSILTFKRKTYASPKFRIPDVMVGAKLHQCLRILPSADTIKRKVWPTLLNESRFQQFLNPNDKSLILNLHEAFIFFDAMIDDSRSLLLHPMSLWTKLVSVVVRGECYYDAIEMCRRLQLDCAVSDIRMLSMLVNCYCCIGCVNYGFGVLGLVVKRGLSADVVFFNTLVKGLGLEKRIEEAFLVVCNLDECGCSPNEVTFGTLFQGLCSAGHLEIAVELSKKLESMNLVCYNIIIDGLIRRGLVYRAEEMIAVMRAKGILPDQFTYNSFIYFWSCAAQLDKAKGAFFEMIEQGVRPDVVTYSSLVYGMCRVGQLKEAMYMFNEMKGNAISPNVVTYSSLIDGLCRAGELELAMFMFDEMKNNAVAPNAVTYSLMIHGLCCASMLDKALYIFYEMKSRGLTPNVFTYGSIIYGFCLIGDVKGAKRILLDMTMNGVVPDLIIYNIIIDGLCNAGETKEAYHICRSMERRGISPDVVTYNSLIRGFCQVGHWNVVVELLNEMKWKSVFPDVVTYNSIIHGLCRAGEIQKACFKFFEMKKNAVSPNVVTYNSIIHGICCARKFEDALCMLNDMKKSGVFPNVITYTSIFGGFCEVGKWTEAKRILYRMLVEGVRPNAVTLYVIRRAWLKERKKNEIVHYLESVIKEQIAISERLSCRKFKK